MCPGSGIPNPGSGILDLGSRIQELGWTQDPGTWIPDPGSLTLDPARILDPGPWIQDPGSRIQDPGSKYHISKYTRTVGQIHNNNWTNTQQQLDKYTNTCKKWTAVGDYELILWEIEAMHYILHLGMPKPIKPLYLIDFERL